MGVAILWLILFIWLTGVLIFKVVVDSSASLYHEYELRYTIFFFSVILFAYQVLFFVVQGIILIL